MIFTEGKTIRTTISRGSGKVPLKKNTTTDDDTHRENDPQRIARAKKISLVKLHDKNTTTKSVQQIH